MDDTDGAGGAVNAGRVVIGLLHPGDMGAAIGHQLRGRGHSVLWASAGRSPATVARAAAAGLADCGTVAELARRSQVIVSVCPPHAATRVAAQVAVEIAAQGTDGRGGPGFGTGTGTSAGVGVGVVAAGPARIFVDANAVSPVTARQIARIVAGAGLRYVDGGIIGPPPSPAGGTRLYLSGPNAGAVRELFADTAVEARVIERAAAWYTVRVSGRDGGGRPDHDGPTTTGPTTTGPMTAAVPRPRR